MDQRIIKTKKKLAKTIIELLGKKELKEITVLELCQKANINRTTFYKYYNDIDDLIKAIENNIISELEQNINEIKRNYLITYTGKIIEIIKSQKDIYGKLLGKNGDHTFLRQILNLVYNQSIAEWQKLLKKANENDLNKIFNFIVDGSIGIIEKWIESNYPEDPKEISTFINKICMSGLSSYI